MLIKKIIALIIMIFFIFEIFYSFSGSASNLNSVYTYGFFKSDEYHFYKYISSNKNMDISISLKLKNINMLNDYLTSVENPDSPEFHKFISKWEFYRLFSPSNDTVDLILNYLKSYGITGYPGPYNLAIFAHNVPAYKIENAFNVKIAYFQTDGFRKYVFMPVTPVDLPYSIAEYVNGISGLSDNIYYKFDLIKLYNGNISEEGGGDLQKAYQVYGIFNDSYYGNYSKNHVFPLNLTVATVLWEGVDSGGSQVSPYNPSDIYSYYNLTVPQWERNIVKLKVSGYPVDGAVMPGPNSTNDTTGTNYENTLDLEMVTTMAPGVNAFCVYGPGNSSGPSETNFPDEEYASLSKLNDLVAVSNSWGGYNNNGSEAPVDNVSAEYVLMLESTGTTFLASAGDYGDVDNVSMPANYATDTSGFLAVGGTTLLMNGPSGVLNGYGVPVTNSIYNQIVWYDQSAIAYGNIHYGTTSGTSKIYPMPSWQDIPAVIENGGSVKGRDYADISSIGNNTEIFINGGPYQIAGTSVSSPVTAGIIADIVAFTNQKFGFIDPLIYRIGSENKKLPYAPYWDVIQTPAGYHDNQTIYWAKQGWDYASGWGSINAFNFSMDLINTVSKINIIPLNLPENHTWFLNIDGVTFNFTGNVTLNIDNGNHTLSFSSMGYVANPATINLYVNKNLTVYVNFYYDGILNLFIPYIYPDYYGYWNDLKNYSELMNGIQYESYNITSSGSLNYFGDDNITNISEKLKIPTFPMIVNDYNISKTDLVLYNISLQDKLISYAVNLSLKYNYSGYSIDFENPSNADFSTNDSFRFVMFLNNFSIALHKVNKKLIVAVDPAYNGIPNSMLFWYIYHPVIPLYADYYAIMAYETFYMGNYSFQEAVNSIISSTGQYLTKAQIMIILSDINYSTNMPFTMEDLNLRINYTLKNGIKAISIFSMNQNGGFPQSGLWNSFQYYETYNKRHFLVFHEYGLPDGYYWKIDLNNIYYNTTNENIVLFLLPGNYSFKIIPPGGFRSNISSGHVYLNENKTINIEFYLVKYDVTFISNMNISWYLNIPGFGNISIKNRIYNLYMPNGSYNYSAYSTYYYANPGNFIVNGKNITIYVNFSKYIFLNIIFVNYSKTFSINFTLNDINYSVSNCTVKIKNYTIKFEMEKYININKYERIFVKNNSILVNVKNNYTIYVYFIKQFYLNVSSNPAGSAQFSINSGFYNYSEIIKIDVYEKRYYEFEYWLGNGNGSYTGKYENITVKILSPINETSYFSRLYSLTFITENYSFPYYLDINNNSYNVSQNNFTVYLVQGFYNIYAFSENRSYNFNTSVYLNENLTLHISWKIQKYYAIFEEIGLKIPLNISVNRMNYTLKNNLSIPLPNGSYRFMINPPYYINTNITNGTLIINGSEKIIRINVSLKIFNYTIYVPFLNRTDTEIILYGNDILGEKINYTLYSKNGEFIFHVPAGKYNFTVLLNKQKITSGNVTISKNLNEIINNNEGNYFYLWYLIILIIGIVIIILSLKRKKR
ncbi:MAG: protease pro-enzyme activation domain-containing protein [Thermoplasmata archaeon]